MVSEKRALREEKEPHILKILMPFIFRIFSRARFLVRRARKTRIFLHRSSGNRKKKTFFS